MSWFSRKYTKSDWQDTCNYIQYFENKSGKKDDGTWTAQTQVRLIEEQRKERDDIWNAYMQSRHINP